MNTQKAAYWLALAVFGLALHSEYQHGSFPALHRVAGCAGSTLYRIARHAEQTLAMAVPQTAPSAFRTDDLEANAKARELAEAKAELAREEAQDKAEELREQTRDVAELLRDQARARAAMIRAQVQLQRAQIEQIHRCVRSQLRASNVVNRRIVVRSGRDTDLSDIEVADSF